MRQSWIFFVAVCLVGCSSAPKPEVTGAEVAGNYKMYVEPALNETDQLSLIVMRSAEFITLQINADGTYKAILDNKMRPNNGAMLDEGTYDIQGKDLLFHTKHPATPTERKEQCFTNLGESVAKPSGVHKYRFAFKNGDKIVMYKQ